MNYELKCKSSFCNVFNLSVDSQQFSMFLFCWPSFDNKTWKPKTVLATQIANDYKTMYSESDKLTINGTTAAKYCNNNDNNTFSKMDIIVLFSSRVKQKCVCFLSFCFICEQFFVQKYLTVILWTSRRHCRHVRFSYGRFSYFAELKISSKLGHIQCFDR